MTHEREALRVKCNIIKARHHYVRKNDDLWEMFDVTIPALLDALEVAEAGIKRAENDFPIMYMDVRNERDHWKARAEAAEAKRDNWKHECAIAQKHYDAWKARAEALERAIRSGNDTCRTCANQGECAQFLSSFAGDCDNYQFDEARFTKGGEVMNIEAILAQYPEEKPLSLNYTTVRGHIWALAAGVTRYKRLIAVTEEEIDNYYGWGTELAERLRTALKGGAEE